MLDTKLSTLTNIRPCDTIRYSLLGFAPGKRFARNFDLPVVVRFVFAHVEPFAVIIRRTPRPSLVDRHQPPLAAFHCSGSAMSAA